MTKSTLMDTFEYISAKKNIVEISLSRKERNLNDAFGQKLLTIIAILHDFIVHINQIQKGSKGVDTVKLTVLYYIFEFKTQCESGKVI